jgi:hypothetical protein
VLTDAIISILGFFSSEFSRPTWINIQMLFLGATLCRRDRTITNILRVMGLSDEKNFSKYHRVLSRAKWNELALSKILLGLLIQALPSSWPVLIAVDETLERRKGKKIKGIGSYRDAVQSSQSYVVKCFGLKWECMTLIVPLPWCKRPWALPFLTVLAPSKKSNEAAGKRHKTSIDWTRQMMLQVCRWLKKKPWILLGDGAYACMDLATACIKRKVTLVSRLRLDAQLYQYPEYPTRKLGRRKIKGERIKLKSLLTDSEQDWQKMTVSWYGGTKKEVEFLSFTCLWYHAGKKPMPLKIVLVKTPDGKNVAETFFSTDLENTALQIINWFVLRWNIEVTFEEARAHLGVETQRQWSDKAIQRTTPLLFGLYSVLTLIALKINAVKSILTENTTWYNKNGEATFADIITTVRREIWSKKYFSKSENSSNLVKFSRTEVNSLIYQLALAA